MPSDLASRDLPQTPAPPRMGRAWAAVFIMQFLYILAMIDRNLIALLVTPIKHSLGITDFQLSMLQGTAFGLFYATFGLLTGWLLDRFSRRRVIYAGVTLWSIAATSCGLAQSYAQLMLSRFGVGAGEAVLSPAAYAIISTLFPRGKLGFAIGVYGIGAILGGAIALSLGGVAIASLNVHGAVALPLVGTVAPWQAIFIIFGLPGIVIAPIVFLITRDADRSASPARFGAPARFRAFLRARRAYLFWHFTGFGNVTLIAYAQSSWLATYLVRHFHLDMATIGTGLAGATALGGVTGFLGSGWIVDRWFDRGATDAHFRYAAFATLGLGMAGIGCYCVQWLPGVFVLAALTYAFFSISGLAAAHLQIVTPPALRARTSALYLLVINVLGLCMGPSVVAAFTDFLFHDPDKIGLSLILTFAIFAPLAACAFSLGREPARRAVADVLSADAYLATATLDRGSRDGKGCATDVARGYDDD